MVRREGVRPQDLLAQAAGTAVDDENEVTDGDPETARVARLEDGLDPRQFDEVVAPADHPETLDMTGGNMPADRLASVAEAASHDTTFSEPAARCKRFRP